MEIARGTAGDRPWPELFATLAFTGEPCELVVELGAQVHRVAFADQAVIAASSPLPSDSALRVMRTLGVITPGLMPAVASRVAAMPSADPIEVLASVAQLPPETALLMRRRTIAVAATRVFALVTGTYRVTSELTLRIKPGTAIDVRALIYEGIRTHVSDEQLAGTLARHGTSFVLRSEVDHDLLRFGFSPAELPIVEELRGGASLADLELHHPEIGARGVHAIVSALLAARAIDPAPRPSPALPRASNQHPTPALARSSDRLPAQRTTGQFSTQVPVTGRFAARTGKTGVFEVPALPLDEDPRPARTTGSQRAVNPSGTFELAEQPRSRISATIDIPQEPKPGTFELAREPASPIGRAEQPRARTTGTFALAEQPRSRTTGMIAAVEPPRDEAPRTFTTRPPTTGVFAVPVRDAQPTPPHPTSPHPALDPRPVERSTGSHRVPSRPATIDPTAEFSVTIRPARTTFQGPAVSAPAQTPEVTASQHYDRGMALLDRDPDQAIGHLATAARMSGDVDHEAMLAWAQFCAAPHNESVAKSAKAALANAMYRSPKPVLAHFYLGRMARMLNRDREALSHFKAVVELMPRHAEALAEIHMIEARLYPKR